MAKIVILVDKIATEVTSIPIQVAKIATWVTSVAIEVSKIANARPENRLPALRANVWLKQSRLRVQAGLMTLDKQRLACTKLEVYLKVIAVLI